MENLSIKGHATRGKEIIELLEMLGANKLGYKDTFVGFYYYIECGTICSSDEYPIYSTIFTLEEFLEKYPYKVGDYARLSRSNIAVIIKAMKWENNEVVYQLSCSDGWWSVDNLKQYKEKQMEEPKELLIGFTKDTDGNWVLNAHKDYEIKEVDGKFKLIQKQSQYPKTYIECAKILDCFSTTYIDGYKNELLEKFQKLLIARNAYWKLAGEQMGLDKPWEPNWTTFEGMPAIFRFRYNIVCDFIKDQHCLLVFPTEEMRDAFYENFKDLIETCKELL